MRIERIVDFATSEFTYSVEIEKKSRGKEDKSGKQNMRDNSKAIWYYLTSKNYSNLCVLFIIFVNVKWWNKGTSIPYRSFKIIFAIRVYYYYMSKYKMS